MYPDLSYIINDLFDTGVGFPFDLIKTFGSSQLISIAVITFTAWGGLVKMEQRGIVTPIKTFTTKKGFNVFHSLLDITIAFLIGYKLAFLFSSDTLQDPKSWASTEGSVYGGILMSLVSMFLQYNRYIKNKRSISEGSKIKVEFPSSRILVLMILCGISGMVFSKIVVLIENSGVFLKSPLETILNTGTAFYGAATGVFIVVYPFCRRYNIPVLRLLDHTSIGTFFGYGIGRLGCHLAGDGCWGIANDLDKPSFWLLPEWTWSFDYPFNVINEGVLIDSCIGTYCHQLSNGVFPTSFYEFVLSFVVGTIVWKYRNRIIEPGTIFSILLLFNGIERFLIGFIRDSDLYQVLFFELSQAQIIAVFLMVLGGFLLIKRLKTISSFMVQKK